MRWSILVLLVACSKSAPPSGEPAETAPRIKAGIAVTETTLSETTEYKVALGVPETSTMFQLTVTPKQGWKINPDYPSRLAVTPAAGCALSKPTQRGADALQLDATRASWQFDLATCAAGMQQLAGDMRFAVCTEKTCVEKKEKIAIALDVK
ncbi:MAG: hypothetical protein H0V17_13480 [Deltaproteobacteria bacterium]|nr:hypothetical protein [Deltaproteobacteria bacterium]